MSKTPEISETRGQLLVFPGPEPRVSNDFRERVRISRSRFETHPQVHEFAIAYVEDLLKSAEDEATMKGYISEEIKNEWQNIFDTLVKYKDQNPVLKALYAKVMAFGLIFNGEAMETVHMLLREAETEVKDLLSQDKEKVEAICRDIRAKINQALGDRDIRD